MDAYLGIRFGELPYLSLDFKHETLEQEHALPAPVVNFPDEDFSY